MGMEVAGAERKVVDGATDDELVEIARSWTIRALESVIQGKSGHYTSLLTALRNVQLDVPKSLSALQIRLKALSQAVSLIDEHYHQDLLVQTSGVFIASLLEVMQVLGMSVWIYGTHVADALLEFVVNLATANGGCTGQCLDMLVRNFLPPSCGLPAFLDTYSRFGLMSGLLSSEKIYAQQAEHLALKDEVLARVHAAIHQIVELVPTTILRLHPIVLKRMPHRTAPREWNILYLENMLRLERCSMQLMGNQLLTAVVDHLIQIDVEIRWEDILTEEESSKLFLFHMDLEEDIEDRDTDLSPSDPMSPGVEAKLQHGLVGRPSKGEVPTLDEMADKMDHMMELTFEHLKYCCREGHTQKVYDTLIKSFQSTILDTYKSKFTQFLIFYLCSLAPSTCGSNFASLLCDIFSSRNRPPNTRMAAAAYLASYLARSRFLSTDVIVSSLQRLVDWCVTYSPPNDAVKNSMVGGSTTQLHGVFYSGCQAVMYILCFRFKCLMEDVEKRHELRALPLQLVVEHQLNPLKVCLPSVVEEFLKQATTLQFVQDKNWLNSKEHLDSQRGGTLVGDVRLDMFFPFDPYLLRRSDRFVRPCFTYWSMVQPVEDTLMSDVEDQDKGDLQSDSSWNEDSPAAQLSCPYGSVGGISVDEFVFHQEQHEKIGESLSYGGESHEGDNSLSDRFCVDGFRDCINLMGVTPPQALPKLPAKLCSAPISMHPPAKLPAKLPLAQHLIVGFREL